MAVKNNNQKKRKVKILPVIILAVLVIALIVGAGSCVAAKQAKKKEQESRVEVNLNQTNLKNESVTTPEPVAKTTIEIMLDNSAIPVGTTIQVTALVTPADTENALAWSSSTEAVFTVSSDGVVTITGTGTAALTATIGTVADAVAIEGISSVTAGSTNHYPVYTGGTASGLSATGTSGNAGDGGSLAQGNGSGSSSAGSGDESGNDSNSGDTSGQSGNNFDGGNSGGTDSNNNGSSSGSGSGSGNGLTGDSGSGSGSGESGQGTSSTDIGGSLPGYGFTQTMSNVYVCQENDTYYGEIVTQPNVTIIYIKQRNGTFDSRINNVLAQLLPEEHNQVWSNYLSAATDRTFTAEGRRVRIVAATGGGHSQIVIYN